MSIVPFDAGRYRNPSLPIPLGQLQEVGDALAAAFVTLSRDPRPDACEVLATRLNGTARAILQLRSALLAQDRDTPPPSAA